MNQLDKSVSAVFLAITLATTLGCAATPTRESTGQYIDDAAITAKVKAAILDRPTLKVLDIHVQTVRGVVQLWGTVGTQAQIDEAGNVAKGVAGVKSVTNDMKRM
ncbi:MAG: BON domain-containing protein [Burkholderiales bacterium]|nr:BON domain-containing protein [Burkholderiales bacterium]